MAEKRTHTKPNSIWLYDYPSLLSMDDCPELMVWLSERDINIIWNAIQNIDRFRSRVFNASEGTTYEIVTPDEFSQFQEFVSDCRVNLGEYEMCNDLLGRIANALEGMSTMGDCCGEIPGASGGSAGTGMVDSPPSTTIDTPEAHAGDPPSGYSDWSQFDSLKCDWANYIYDQIVTDVATLALVEIGVTGAAGLASILVPLLTNPVGWVILLTLATTMIAAAAESAFYGWISTHLDTYRDDYICAMVGGSDVSSSVSGFASRVDANIADDTNFNALTGYWASSILKGLATVASFNRMYEKQSLTVPEAECDCGTGDYEMWIGTETSEHPANPIVAETVFVEGWGCTSDARELAIIFHVPVTITEITGSTGLGCGSCSGALIYHYFDDEDFSSEIHNGNGAPQDDTAVSSVRSMYVLFDCDGNTPTLTITYTLD